MRVLAKGSAPSMKKLRKARAKRTACRLTSVCAAEALAAAQAAKEVDAEKHDNGVVDTREGREKRPPGAGAPRGLLFQVKRRRPKMVNSKCRLSYARTVFRAQKGPAGAFLGPAEAAQRQSGRSANEVWGQLKGAPHQCRRCPGKHP